ncbi:MAG: hypothetical protein DCF21_12150 [Leptolyngbya sp.]|nr:MAG: hypothetical protein DCF21_12150 [Leptolyngbya sp.]
MSLVPENLTSLSASELIAEIARLLEVVRVQQQQIQAQQEMIERLEGQVKQQDERIKQLEDELRAQKKLKGKPKLKASQLNDAPAPEETDAEAGKRSRSGKRSKKPGFAIDREEMIQPQVIPAGARFNGYRTYDVQELELSRQNIRFQLAEYATLDGETVVGQLPEAYRGGHYGPTLVSYVLYQHY